MHLICLRERDHKGYIRLDALIQLFNLGISAKPDLTVELHLPVLVVPDI